MRKFILLSFILSMFLATIAGTAAAQSDTAEDPLSDGCIAFQDLTTTGTAVNFDTLPYNEDEVLIITVTGSGDTFTLLADGSPVAEPVAVGETLVYLVDTADDYTFTIEIEGSDGTS
jgi:hypothetical protein